MLPDLIIFFNVVFFILKFTLDFFFKSSVKNIQSLAKFLIELNFFFQSYNLESESKNNQLFIKYSIIHKEL